VTLLEFEEKRKKYFEQSPKFHRLCLKCMQPQFTCYCEHVRAFDPRVEFVILIHPIEARRHVATGRMSHLTLLNSHLIEGYEFGDNARVNQLLARSDVQPVVLYPGRNSLNMSQMTPAALKTTFDSSKKWMVFVIDGTWTTAKKMLHRSPNLIELPQICFSPQRLSEFKVRKQPAPHCLSTIEAIHEATELLAPVSGFSLEHREHDQLLKTFRQVVAHRLELTRQSREKAGGSQYRRRLNRSA
jgi:DTW domain-containing protein YfiP